MDMWQNSEKWDNKCLLVQKIFLPMNFWRLIMYMDFIFLHQNKLMFYLIIIFIYLSAERLNREAETELQWADLAPWMPAVTRAELGCTRLRELEPGSLHRWQEPAMWASDVSHAHCFPCSVWVGSWSEELQPGPSVSIWYRIKCLNL